MASVMLRRIAGTGKLYNVGVGYKRWAIALALYRLHNF